MIFLTGTLLWAESVSSALLCRMCQCWQATAKKDEGLGKPPRKKENCREFIAADAFRDGAVIILALGVCLGANFPENFTWKMLQGRLSRSPIFRSLFQTAKTATICLGSGFSRVCLEYRHQQANSGRPMDFTLMMISFGSKHFWYNTPCIACMLLTTCAF